MEKQQITDVFGNYRLVENAMKEVWKKIYDEKRITAARAAAMIRSGDASGTVQPSISFAS